MAAAAITHAAPAAIPPPVAAAPMAASPEEIPAAVWVATGSCGTQAGLVTGAAAAGAPYDVVGVTVSRPAAEAAKRVRALAGGAASLVGADVSAARPVVLGGWIGPGYGAPSPEGTAAARLLAAAQGVFLDPTFGASPRLWRHPEQTGNFDVIIDTPGSDLECYRRRLTRNGRMVTVGLSAAALAAIALSSVHGSRCIRTFSANPDAALLRDLAG
jgi:hypothetical protein